MDELIAVPPMTEKWCPYKEMKDQSFLCPPPQRTEQEDSRLQTRGEGLSGAQPRWTPDLGLPWPLES